MQELGKAKAVIVIWTENSATSDWVQSEAGRAHADGKLLPVKAKGLSYKDIPPPFDNMHIESLDDREKLLASVVAVLAKPQNQASGITLLSKQLQLEFLSWFGIVGAVITLTVNLQGLITLAKWVRNFCKSWLVVIKYVWSTVLFFLPHVQADDAVLLTYTSFAAITLMTCLKEDKNNQITFFQTFSISVASIIISGIFMYGLYYVYSIPPLSDSYTLTLMNTRSRQFIFAFSIFIFSLFAISAILYNPFRQLSLSRVLRWVLLSIGLFIGWVGLAFLAIKIDHKVVAFAVTGLFIIVCLTSSPIIALYFIIHFFSSYRLSPAAVSSRLWRIVGGVAIVIALNYASLWVQQQDWIAPLI